VGETGRKVGMGWAGGFRRPRARENDQILVGPHSLRPTIGPRGIQSRRPVVVPEKYFVAPPSAIDPKGAQTCGAPRPCQLSARRPRHISVAETGGATGDAKNWEFDLIYGAILFLLPSAFFGRCSVFSAYLRGNLRQRRPERVLRSYQFHFHGVQLLPFLLRHEAPGRGRRGGGGEERQGPPQPQGLRHPRPEVTRTRLLQGDRATGRRYTGPQCCRYFLHSACRLIVVIRAYCLAS